MYLECDLDIGLSESARVAVTARALHCAMRLTR